MKPLHLLAAGAVPQAHAPGASRQPDAACACGRDDGSGVTRRVCVGSTSCTGVEWPLVPPAHAGGSPCAHGDLELLRRDAHRACIGPWSHIAVQLAATSPAAVTCPCPALPAWCLPHIAVVQLLEVGSSAVVVNLKLHGSPGSRPPSLAPCSSPHRAVGASYDPQNGSGTSLAPWHPPRRLPCAC